MFRVHREQRDAFAGDRVKEFEERLVAHLERHFQARCAILGEGPVLSLVRHGEGRAAYHGIDSERGVTAYVHVMFLHGRDFDTDPRAAWAQAILRGPKPGRAERLLDEALARAGGEAR